MLRVFISGFLLLVAMGNLKSQGVAIGQQPPHTSAALDVQSGHQGLLVPRLSTVQRNNIVLPAKALLLFNTDSACFEVNLGSEEHPIWQKLAFWQEVKQPTEKNWELRGNDSLPTGAYLGSRTAQPLVLQTNQVMRLYIDGEANKMGLFTSTPQAALHIEATDALVVPVGTTGQRPGQPVVGMIRFNKTLGKLEGYTKQGWKPLH